jgi:hypothetical protein
MWAQNSKYIYEKIFLFFPVPFHKAQGGHFLGEISASATVLPCTGLEPKVCEL